MTIDAPLILEFSETVSLTNAAAERDRLIAALDKALLTGPVACVADLSRLQEVDTSVLAVLLAIDRRVREKTSIPLVIRSAPEAVRSLASLSSLDPVLQWEETTAV